MAKNKETSTTSPETSHSRPEAGAQDLPLEKNEKLKDKEEKDGENFFQAILRHLKDLRQERAELKDKISNTSDPNSLSLLKAQIAEVNGKIQKEVKEVRAKDQDLDNELKQIEDKLKDALGLNDKKPGVGVSVIQPEKVSPLDLSKERSSALEAQASNNPQTELNGIIKEEVITQQEAAYQYALENKSKIKKAGGGRIEPEPGQNVTPTIPELERRPGETDEQFEARSANYRSAVQTLLNELRYENRPGMHFAQNPEYMNMMRGGGGNETVPRIEDNPQASLDWFNNRLQTLEEKFYNQSFDQRWQLVYPVEQFILSLDQQGNLPQAFDYHGKHYTTFQEISTDLSHELEARRARHNHTYIFRRVSGTGDLIGAADLLDSKNIETLLKIPEVATTLQRFEGLANDYKAAAGNKTEQARILKDILDLQESNWAGRIAAGLFSGLGEAARHDILINGSGDFFWNRIQNFEDRARKDLVKRYPKGGDITDDVQKKIIETLAPAMNLQTTTYWVNILEAQRQNLGTTENFQRFCRENNIEGIIVDGANADAKADYSHLDLSHTRFTNLNLEREGRDSFNLPFNQLKNGMLDVDDANSVRKALWDPGGFLDKPTDKNLRATYPVMKHLKGTPKYEFYEKLGNALIGFNKEENWWIPKPGPLGQFSTSLGSKAYGWDAWGPDAVKSQIDYMSKDAIIDKKIKNKMNKEHLGGFLARTYMLSSGNIFSAIFGAFNDAYKAAKKELK